jgi:hypothetical protein
MRIDASQLSRSGVPRRALMLPSILCAYVTVTNGTPPSHPLDVDGGPCNAASELRISSGDELIVHDFFFLLATSRSHGELERSHARAARHMGDE